MKLELKADNKSFLIAALKSLGHAVLEIGDTVTFTTRGSYYNQIRGVFANGKLQLSGADDAVKKFDINAVKRAYSVQVVQFTAKKFGWSLKQESATKFAVQKRGF